MNIYIVRIKQRMKGVKVLNDIMGVYTSEDSAYECISETIKSNPSIEDEAYFDIDYMILDERADETIIFIGD
ncbi:hypothetical protein [Apilactobacillus kunkeei]|uniref:hypothetical protein n=1 Tax=Apilactobacillus kunkeei TaxID=148814 RepID=UPI0007109848|nr:hypothetical protein [Apilactobacillus kunkeei]